MLQSGLDPWTIHREYDVALAQPISFIFLRIVGGPALHIIPAQTSLDNVVTSKKSNIALLDRVLRAFECEAGKKIDLRSQSRLHPPRPALGEDGMEVAFEEGAGVLEVPFGIGFGGGQALKRFVQQANDAVLFGERGGWE